MTSTRKNHTGLLVDDVGGVWRRRVMGLGEASRGAGVGAWGPMGVALALVVLAVGCESSNSSTPVTAAGGDAGEFDAGVSEPGGDDADGDDAGVVEPGGDDAGVVDAGPAPSGVPLIQDVLGCAVTDEYRLARGDELHRVTLTEPGAVCNDGTPAVLFVRAATNPALADRWVFHLQGGGSCAEQDCALRWCSNAGLMSSMNAPESVTDAGIFSQGRDNAFGGANQVYVTYCSSDNHAGTSGEVVIPANDQHEAFRLHFQGDAIVQAAAAAIESGVTSDDGEETLPALASGDSVLLTGTSAGCGGVAHQADRLFARWARLGVSTLAVGDSCLAPAVGDFTTPMAQEYAVMAESSIRAVYEVRMRTQALRLDESCVAAEQAEPFRCSISGHVLAEHVTEPRLFIFKDNTDSNTVKGLIDLVGEEATPERRAQAAAILAPATRRALARAADGTGGTEISVYGRTCGYHVALTRDNRFFEHSVPTPDGPLTYHDALVRWASGDTVIAIDSVEAPSSCDD